METKVFDLVPQIGNQKSFYGRAKIEEVYDADDKLLYIHLWSYTTKVVTVSFRDKTLYIKGYYSSTTSKHVWHFLIWLSYEYWLNFNQAITKIQHKEKLNSFKKILEQILTIDLDAELYYHNKEWKPYE